MDKSFDFSPRFELVLFCFMLFFSLSLFLFHFFERFAIRYNSISNSRRPLLRTFVPLTVSSRTITVHFKKNCDSFAKSKVELNSTLRIKLSARSAIGINATYRLLFIIDHQFQIKIKFTRLSTCKLSIS